MTKINFMKDILVFIFLYLPPLILFIRFSRERNRGRFLLTCISIIYIIASIFTQNLIPFIFVLINMRYLRMAKNSINSINRNEYVYFQELSHSTKPTISNRLAEDYEKFKFSIRELNILSAVKHTIQSYFMTIVISAVTYIIFYKLNVDTKQQEIVTWMANMPISRFLITIPIVIIFAPIVEEFVFRWLLFEKIFKPRLGVYLSAVLSSIIFAFIHFNLRALPILIWIGLFNCYLINKKGYWYSVFNHFTFNLITIMFLLVEKLGSIK